jgi:hypothetical protein
LQAGDKQSDDVAEQTYDEKCARALQSPAIQIEVADLRYY